MTQKIFQKSGDKLIILFLTGDVMTGRGVGRVLENAANPFTMNRKEKTPEDKRP